MQKNPRSSAAEWSTKSSRDESGSEPARFWVTGWTRLGDGRFGKNAWWAAFGALVALAAVFEIPYHVPQAPSGSISYVFGFNNRAGIVLLLLFSAVVAWLLRRTRFGSTDAKNEGISWGVVGGVILAGACFCAAMYLLIGRRFENFWEGSYEIERVWLLAHGKLPYVDFEWPFGWFLLYGPMWASRLFHLSLRDATYSLWAINTALGFLLLAVTVSLVDFPTRRRTTLFLLFSLVGLVLIPMMATHYTLLRYTCPLLLVTVLWRLQCKAITRGRQLVNAALSILFVAVLFTISPETAIGFTFVSLVLFWPLRKHMAPLPRPGILPFLLLLAGDGVLVAISYRSHLLATLLSSGGGSESLPMVISPTLLFFFIAVASGVTILVRQLLGTIPLDGTSVLILYSLPLLAAALSRCDPVHVACNGMGILLAVAFHASARKMTRRVFNISYAICLAGVAAAGTCRLMWPTINRVLHESMRQDVASQRSGLVSRVVAFGLQHTAGHRWTSKAHRALLRAQQDAMLTQGPASIDSIAMFPPPKSDLSDGVLQVPFRFYPVAGIAHQATNLDTGYYGGFENANTKLAVDRKISELSAHPYRRLLVPLDYETYCADDLNQDRVLLRQLFMVPYPARVMHVPGLRQPLCNYITSHYRVGQAATKDSFGYEVLEPRVPRS